jgi:hypothetical protein
MRTPEEEHCVGSCAAIHHRDQRLAANLLTAVGGRPRFTADAVPSYPEAMRHHGPKVPLVLYLAPASVELVRDVFLGDRWAA